MPPLSRVANGSLTHRYAFGDDDLEAQSRYHISKNPKEASNLSRLTSVSETSLGASWMSNVQDDVPVPILTIPGTHDSAAYTYPWPFIATQNLDFKQQLDAGIRYFDIRCGLRKNVVELVHGPTLLGLTLISVLETMYAWLEKHPSEGIIVQLKKDRKNDRSTVKFSVGIIQTLSKNITRWRTARTPPLMSELRGKIQLFRRFTGSDLDMLGLDVTRWQDNPKTPFTIFTPEGDRITIQDHYTSVTPDPLPSLLDNKEANVNELLQRASGSADERHWFINFTSAFEVNLYYQISPRAVAIGAYWGFRKERGINLRLRKTLAAMNISARRRLGIVVMDFPEQGTDDLIQALINTNFIQQRRLDLPWVTTILLITAAIFMACVLIFCCGQTEFCCLRWSLFGLARCS